VLRFVNLHYAPDVASTGQHLTDLAEHLAASGLDVEVITAGGHYIGGRVSAPRNEQRNGVRVRRLRSPGFGRRWRIGRLVDYAAFYLQVLWLTCLGRRSDATVFLTTPPLLCVAGWIGRWLRGSPYAIWSMDLHPDAELAAGMLRTGGVVARLLTWLNDRGYRAADFVVDLGPHMRQRVLAKGVAPDRLHTVAVWGPAPDAEQVNAPELAASVAALRRRWGVADQCVVMYAGNAGIVHDFDAVLGAMQLLANDPTVYFVFVGGGPRRREIEQFVEARSIRNFAYYAYVPREEVAQVLAAGDIHLITLRASFAGIAVPGKLYGIMGAARPALFVGPSGCETADAIRASDGGIVIDPSGGDATQQLVTAIQRWRDDPGGARSVGRRGFDAYVRSYQRDPNCEAFAHVLAARWPGACGRTSQGTVIPFLSMGAMPDQPGANPLSVAGTEAERPGRVGTARIA
jgi:colanic acid biosynthesis glycosyl transferase WcaI